jgi:hypothetical protein
MVINDGIVSFRVKWSEGSGRGMPGVPAFLSACCVIDLR